MNDLLNPEDTAPAESQHGRAFFFNGQELQPFSFLHRAAFYRITRGEGVSAFEEAYILLYLLTKDRRTADAVRDSAQIAAFREQAGLWAETAMPTPAMQTEAFATVSAVWEDLTAADAIHPVADKGGSPGKA